MIKILVVEDNIQISENVKQYLKTEFEVKTAYRGDEAVDMLNLHEFDLVVLDLMIPEIDGMSVLSYIKSQRFHTGVIILTAKEELDEKLRAFEIGANDYLTKPFFMEELKARIYLTLRNMGKLSMQNDLILGDLRLCNIAHKVVVMTSEGETEIELINKLYGLLEYLLLNKNVLLFKEQIFQRICGYDSDANEQIVEVYISYLRKKLAPFGLDKCILTRRGVGYKLVDPEEVSR